MEWKCITCRLGRRRRASSAAEETQHPTAKSCDKYSNAWRWVSREQAIFLFSNVTDRALYPTYGLEFLARQPSRLAAGATKEDVDPNPPYGSAFPARSQPFLGEGSARSGLKVFLKRKSLPFVRESDVGFYFPGTELRGVGNFVSVVLKQPGFDVTGDAGVKSAGVTQTLENVDKFHGVA